MTFTSYELPSLHLLCAVYYNRSEIVFCHEIKITTMYVALVPTGRNTNRRLCSKITISPSLHFSSPFPFSFSFLFLFLFPFPFPFPFASPPQPVFQPVFQTSIPGWHLASKLDLTHTIKLGCLLFLSSHTSFLFPINVDNPILLLVTQTHNLGFIFSLFLFHSSQTITLS